MKIIENNFHLISSNEILIQELVKYIRHVAVFKSLRLSEAKLNPIDVGEPFPPNIANLVSNETENKINSLLLAEIGYLFNKSNCVRFVSNYSTDSID